MCDTLGTQQVKHFQIINECVRLWFKKEENLLLNLREGRQNSSADMSAENGSIIPNLSDIMKEM